MKKINVNSFEFVSRQYTIFFASPQLAISDFIKKILPIWIADFPENPVVLPTENNMPYEVPRIILNHQNKSQIQLSNVRLDITLFNDKSNSNFIVDADERIEKYMETFSKSLNWDIGRIASTITKEQSIDNPGKVLSEHFCKEKFYKGDGALKRPITFQLDSHKAFLMGNFEVNSWMRNHTKQNVNSSNSNSIICLNDINTIPSSQKKYSLNEIIKFYSLSKDESDKILNLYYP